MPSLSLNPLPDVTWSASGLGCLVTVWSESVQSELDARSEAGQLKTRTFALGVDVQPDNFQPDLELLV